MSAKPEPKLSDKLDPWVTSLYIKERVRGESSNTTHGDRKRSEIFAFIVQFLNARGYSPSIREIGEAVGLSSSSTIHRHLQTMQAAGLIKLRKNQFRAIQINQQAFRKLDVFMVFIEESLDTLTSAVEVLKSDKRTVDLAVRLASIMEENSDLSEFP